MSPLHHRFAEISDLRILAMATATSNLTAQLNELNELREQVRKAQLSDRESRRIDKSKSVRL
jgi:hypothetical protein